MDITRRSAKWGVQNGLAAENLAETYFLATSTDTFDNFQSPATESALELAKSSGFLMIECP